MRGDVGLDRAPVDSRPSIQAQVFAHEWFVRQARSAPGRTALEMGQERVTYGELDRRSDRVALYLQRLGVRPDTRVGVELPRSPQLIEAILGVMKAGGAYLPLDRAYPRKRRDLMIADAGATIVIRTDSDSREDPRPSCREIAIEAMGDVPLNLAPERVALHPRNLAYVIYTSGSTGRPKGVAVEHAGLLNLIEAELEWFGFGPDDRVLQFASTSFDTSVWEIFPALAGGATLVLLPRESVLHPAFLAAELDRAQPTWATLPPSVLLSLPSLPRSLRMLVAAGEACPPRVSELWGGDRRFFNSYGPTEATVCATMAEGEEGSAPPIGRPIQHVTAHVLDPELRTVPIGEPGELYIGGAGIARGYASRPRLTAERFLPDPFGRSGARMYRTGDLVRSRQSGDLEYLGRTDEQVKIRGIRIEPGEIANTLREHSQIVDAAVLAQDLAGAGATLVAYVVPRASSIDIADVRSFASAYLPYQMVPERFVLLDALPLTANGKVDRAALARLSGAGVTARGRVGEAPDRSS